MIETEEIGNRRDNQWLTSSVVFFKNMADVDADK